MTILDDLPQLAQGLEEISKISADLRNREQESAWSELQDPESDTRHTIRRLEGLRDQFNVSIQKHKVSQSVKDRFFSEVSADLKNPSFFGTKIIVCFQPTLLPTAETDWFRRVVVGPRDHLDTDIRFYVFHHDLIRQAESLWAQNDRVTIEHHHLRIAHQSTAVAAARANFLHEHGLQNNQIEWEWAVAAIDAAQLGLKHLKLEFHLCDYVEWTSTQIPTLSTLSDVFEQPKLYIATGFGAAAPAGERLEPIDGGNLWKTQNGTFISPLWEYLRWHDQIWHDQNFDHDVAGFLAQIGEGIDAALRFAGCELTPLDDNVLKLCPSYIFRAGEAMARLRVALELSDVILEGKQSKATAKKRADTSGAQSANTRKKRIVSLLEQMEILASNNPDMARTAPKEFERLACNNAREAEPAIWKQGANQLVEYVGELRRGDAGEDLKARYKAISQKTA